MPWLPFVATRIQTRGQGSAKSEPVCSEGAARPAPLLSSASRVKSWRTAKGEFRRPNLAVAAGARRGAHAVRALTGKSSEQKGATESQRYRDREENNDFLHWPIAPKVDTDPTAEGRRILRIVPVKFGRAPSVRSGRDTVSNPTVKGCVVSPSTDQGVRLPGSFRWHEIRGQYVQPLEDPVFFAQRPSAACCARSMSGPALAFTIIRERWNLPVLRAALAERCPSASPELGPLPVH